MHDQRRPAKLDGGSCSRVPDFPKFPEISHVLGSACEVCHIIAIILRPPDDIRFLAPPRTSESARHAQAERNRPRVLGRNRARKCDCASGFKARSAAPSQMPLEFGRRLSNVSSLPRQRIDRKRTRDLIPIRKGVISLFTPAIVRSFLWSPDAARRLKAAWRQGRPTECR